LASGRSTRADPYLSLQARHEAGDLRETRLRHQYQSW
jgi:hypothetical protein